MGRTALARTALVAREQSGDPCPSRRRARAADGGQARDRLRADPVQADGGPVLRPSTSAGRPAARNDRRLRRAAHRGDRVLRAPRRGVRQGCAARDSHGRAADVPASARPVVELPPRAADGRPLARDRARHYRHRHAAHVHAVQHRADADRDRAGLRDPLGVLRLYVCARHARLRGRATSRTRCS